MPYAKHKTVFKRVRQNKKRAQRNKAVRTRIKNVTQELRDRVESGEASQEEIQSALLKATRTLDKAASKGVIPKQRASRRISRLTRYVNRNA